MLSKTKISLAPTKNRIESLDYLRGLAALSILSFHFSTWIFGEQNPDSFLGKIGFYGVSIFYILSGLTLYYVYKDKIEGATNIKIFFLKRIFRIYPLLFLVTTLNLVFGSTAKNIWIYLSNITGLFGFIDPDGYIATGAWSIGNELVFYLFFPIILIIGKNTKYLFSILFFVMVAIGVYFSFFYISSQSSLENEWYKYVNPFNQIFLFFSGVLIGMMKRRSIKPLISILALLVLIIIFSLYPINNEIQLITNIERLVFSFIMFLICMIFYWTNYDLHTVFKKILVFFGDISYSVYLLHPITYAFLLKLTFLQNSSFVFLACNIVLAVIVSAISYFFLEKTVVKWGNSYCVKLKTYK